MTLGRSIVFWVHARMWHLGDSETGTSPHRTRYLTSEYLPTFRRSLLARWDLRSWQSQTLDLDLAIDFAFQGRENGLLDWQSSHPCDSAHCLSRQWSDWASAAFHWWAKFARLGVFEDLRNPLYAAWPYFETWHHSKLFSLATSKSRHSCSHIAACSAKRLSWKNTALSLSRLQRYYYYNYYSRSCSKRHRHFIIFYLSYLMQAVIDATGS